MPPPSPFALQTPLPNPSPNPPLPGSTTTTAPTSIRQYSKTFNQLPTIQSLSLGTPQKPIIPSCSSSSFYISPPLSPPIKTKPLDPPSSFTKMEKVWDGRQAQGGGELAGVVSHHTRTTSPLFTASQALQPGGGDTIMFSPRVFHGSVVDVHLCDQISKELDVIPFIVCWKWSPIVVKKMGPNPDPNIQIHGKPESDVKPEQRNSCSALQRRQGREVRPNLLKQRYELYLEIQSIVEMHDYEAMGVEFPDGTDQVIKAGLGKELRFCDPRMTFDCKECKSVDSEVCSMSPCGIYLLAVVGVMVNTSNLRKSKGLIQSIYCSVGIPVHGTFLTGDNEGYTLNWDAPVIGEAPPQFSIANEVFDELLLSGWVRVKMIDCARKVIDERPLQCIVPFSSMIYVIIRVTAICIVDRGGSNDHKVVNHDVSDELIEELKGELEKFFKLFLKEKEELVPLPGDLQGNGRKLVLNEGKLGWQSMMCLFSQLLQFRNLTFWPTSSPIFKSTLNKYSTKHESVSQYLFDAIAKDLSLYLELLDAGGLTPLIPVKDVQGLQIKRKGKWLPVELLEHALIANMGDTLEIVINEEYTNVEHRVMVNKKKDRLSIIAYHSPIYDQSAYGFGKPSAIQQRGIFPKGLDVIQQEQAGIGRIVLITYAAYGKSYRPFELGKNVYAGMVKVGFSLQVSVKNAVLRMCLSLRNVHLGIRDDDVKNMFIEVVQVEGAMLDIFCVACHRAEFLSKPSHIKDAELLQLIELEFSKLLLAYEFPSNGVDPWVYKAYEFLDVGASYLPTFQEQPRFPPRFEPFNGFYKLFSCDFKGHHYPTFPFQFLEFLVGIYHATVFPVRIQIKCYGFHMKIDWLPGKMGNSDQSASVAHGNRDHNTRSSIRRECDMQCFYHVANGDLLLHLVMLELLVHWTGRPPEDVTWRTLTSSCKPCPNRHLEDKVVLKSGGIDTILPVVWV